MDGTVAIDYGPSDTPEQDATDLVAAELALSPEWDLLRGEGVAVTPGAEGADNAEEIHTELSIQCALDAYRGDMSKFAGLTDEQRAKLHEDTRAIGDKDALKVFCYKLLVHDVGKRKDIVRAVGAGGDVDHDEVLTMLVTEPQHEEARRRFLPGFDNLPEWGKELFIQMARMRLNYPQILQGEAPAATLEGINHPDPRVIQWEILKSKFDIFGKAGHINQDVSLTATASTVRRMDNLDSALIDPTLATAEDRNNAFLDREIVDMTGDQPPADAEELRQFRALARLACHLRAPNPEAFAALRRNFEAQVPVIKEILVSELNRSARPTLAYYSPELLRTVTEREGGEFALTYFAHVLQEAHIADLEARRAGQPGISTVLLDEHIRAIKEGNHNPREQAMRFALRDGALVAETRPATLETLADIPEFTDTDAEALRQKRVMLVGEGGGSDCIQAAMVGKILSNKYGCEVVAVVSSRNEHRQVQNTGWESGTVKEITPQTEPVGDWRFLENIPLEGDSPSPTFILNSSDPYEINCDLQALAYATDADVIIGVDTGGDSLYRTQHAGFSGRSEADITPDHDYNTISGLAKLAKSMSDIPVLSVIVAPGVDSPSYAHQVIDRIGARRLPLGQEDRSTIRQQYAEWRMDGSGSEEGRYGKTPLAWLHSLQERTGVQVLDLPVRNLTSDTNPWRAFTTITPAMSEVLITDISAHFEAISREPSGPPTTVPGTPEQISQAMSFTSRSNVRFEWNPESPSDIHISYEPPQTRSTDKKYIGGYGMTARTLATIDQTLPEAVPALLAEQGKILILGNGFSLAPLEIYEQSDPALRPDIVVADAVDYRQMQMDLTRLVEQIDRAGIERPVPLTDALARCELLLAAQAAGQIKLVQHIVGTPQPPQEIGEASVAINVYGPPPGTINDQLACLKPGGRLFVAGSLKAQYFLESIGDEFNYRAIYSTEGIRGYEITRLA